MNQQPERKLYGRTFYQLHTVTGAMSALESVQEYADYKSANLPGRYDSVPAAKLLCWSHVNHMAGRIKVTGMVAREAFTTLPSIKKTLPPSWCSYEGKTLFVQFPRAIEWGDDLPIFQYLGRPPIPSKR